MLLLVLLAVLAVLVPLIVLFVPAVEGSTVAEDVKLAVRAIGGLRIVVDPDLQLYNFFTNSTSPSLISFNCPIT